MKWKTLLTSNESTIPWKKKKKKRKVENNRKSVFCNQSFKIEKKNL